MYDSIGGMVDRSTDEVSKEVLIYNANEDKWKKVGDLCHGRAYHAMSLVPVESEIEDQCILDMDCF